MHGFCPQKLWAEHESSKTKLCGVGVGVGVVSKVYIHAFPEAHETPPIKKKRSSLVCGAASPIALSATAAKELSVATA